MADDPTKEEMAALAGYTTSFFSVTPEMKQLFEKALDELWEPARLQAAIRNTKWYKSTSQTERESWLLKSSDPAEYRRRNQEMASRVSRLAAELGFPLPKGAVGNIANNALMKGWNDDQIRRYMGNWSSAFGQAAQKGNLGGTLADAQTNIAAAARANGVNLSQNFMTTWLRHILTGQATEEQVLQKIRNLAASSFPGLADDINAGVSVMDIASPYFESMGRILEVNPESLDLFDPTIRRALSQKSKDGKWTAQGIGDFEETLRKDPRWFKTNNFRETGTSVGREVLTLMGMVA